MNGKVELLRKAPLEKGNRFDMFKWTVVVLLLVAGIAANVMYAKVALALRLMGWIALLAITAAVAYQTEKGKQAWAFIQAAQVEMRKVVWPTRKETIQTTWIVAAMVCIMSLVLWGVDNVVLWAIGFITGQRG